MEKTEKLTESLQRHKKLYQEIRNDSSQLWNMMEVRDDICDDLAELALVVAKSVYKNETLEASYKISVSRKVKELTSGKVKVSNAKAEAIAEVEFADLLTEWKENAGITKAGRMVLSHFSSLEDSIKQRISNIKKTELGGV